MPTRHGLFIRRPRVAAMLLMLVSCVTSATFAQNANKPNHQPPTQANQPETRATFRENLAAEYETIRMSKPDGSVVLLRVPKQQRWPGPVASPGRRPTTRGPTGRASIPLSISSELVPSLYGVHGVRISLPYTGTRTFDTGTPLGDLLLQHGGRGRVGTAVVAGDDPTEWRTGRGWVPGGEGKDNGDYLSDLAPDFPALKPGDGWDGPTQGPPPVGNQGDPGWDAKAIARWDVVPYQTITEDFHIGVVAFHINGIDRVEFSVDDGPWVAAREMQLNPRTGVWEYTVILRPELFAEDGLVEVRAVAYPKTSGLPRLLAGPIDQASVRLGEHSLLLSTNFNHTLPAPVAYVATTGSDASGDGTFERPFRSIAKAGRALGSKGGTGLADGGTVYLLPGAYSWGPAERDHYGNYIGSIAVESRFLTVTTAPNVPREQVLLASSGAGGLKTTLVHLKGLQSTVAAINSVPGGTSPIVWIDDCAFRGTGRTHGSSWAPPTSWPGGIFLTDSTVSSARYGFTGGVAIGRNLLLQQLGEDAFVNPGMLINCRVFDIDTPDGSGYHSDVIQFFTTGDDAIRNRIVYGLTALDCTSQGWNIGYTGHTPSNEWQDLAFVNVLIEADATQQWIPSANHVLWWHMTTADGPVSIRNNPDTGGGNGEVCRIRNFSMRGCVLNRFSVRTDDVEPSLTNQHWARSNHFLDTSTYGAMAVGSDASVGGSLESLFEAAESNDFRARLGSPIVNRMLTPLVASDIGGQPLVPPAAIGAAQPFGTEN